MPAALPPSAARRCRHLGASAPPGGGRRRSRGAGAPDCSGCAVFDAGWLAPRCGCDSRLAVVRCQLTLLSCGVCAAPERVLVEAARVGFIDRTSTVTRTALHVKPWPRSTPGQERGRLCGAGRLMHSRSTPPNLPIPLPPPPEVSTARRHTISRSCGS